MLLSQASASWICAELENMGVPRQWSLWVVQRAWNGPYQCAVLVKRPNKNSVVRCITIASKPPMGLTVALVSTEYPSPDLTKEEVAKNLGFSKPSTVWEIVKGDSDA